MLKSADVKLWLTKSFKDQNLQFTAFERPCSREMYCFLVESWQGLVMYSQDPFTPTEFHLGRDLRNSPNHIILMVKKLAIKANFCFSLA